MNMSIIGDYIKEERKKAGLMYLELAVALATWYNKNYISLDKREKAFDYRKYGIAERIIL